MEALHLTTYGSNPTHKDQVSQQNGAIIQPAERRPKPQKSKEMKRERNTQPVKEHDKSPPKLTEEEIEIIPEKNNPE